MPSPFPGMDPYLESPTHWSDFHHEFIGAWRSALLDVLPQNYFARIDEFTVILEPELEHSRAVEPDVLVMKNPGRDAGDSVTTVAVGAGVTMQPVTLTNSVRGDPHTEPFIEIVRLPEQEVVAVLELFSPTNKFGDGRGFYIEKRERLLQSSVHIVELDLIRAGRRLQLSRRLPRGHYYAFVSRGDRRPYCDVYPWTVRTPLPAIPIPLRTPDPDVIVPLADVFRATYDRGRYRRIVDYTPPPPPPAFDGDDAYWVARIAGGDAGK